MQHKKYPVVPKGELPGHSSAAIAAYPWLSCWSRSTSLLLCLQTPLASEQTAQNATGK